MNNFGACGNRRLRPEKKMVKGQPRIDKVYSRPNPKMSSKLQWLRSRQQNSIYSYVLLFKLQKYGIDALSSAGGLVERIDSIHRKEKVLKAEISLGFASMLPLVAEKMELLA